MSVTFRFTPRPGCSLSSEDADVIFAEGAPYSEIVAAARALHKDLTLACIDARAAGDCDAVILTSRKRTAIGFALDELRRGSYEEAHAESPFRHLTCCADWRDIFALDTAAADGTAPKPGQAGVFLVTVGIWTYQTTYQPERFGFDTDHLEFRHWRDGEAVGEKCPLTSTGYRSHFISAAIVDETGDLAKLARMVIEATATVPEDECRQGSLF